MKIIKSYFYEIEEDKEVTKKCKDIHYKCQTCIRLCKQVKGIELYSCALYMSKYML